MKKLHTKLLYEKATRKMLVKLTPIVESSPKKQMTYNLKHEKPGV